MEEGKKNMNQNEEKQNITDDKQDNIDKAADNNLDSNEKVEDSSKSEDEKEKSEETDSEIEKEVLELEKKVEELEKEKDDYYKQLLRLKSDFANYRKRSDKEKEALSLKAKIELINEILPVLDNFERAIKFDDSETEFKDGIQMIYKQLINVLKQEGLEVVPAVGEPFDHRLHEAIMQVEDTEHESGVVVEELQKGYILDDKLVRPAMVKVAK